MKKFGAFSAVIALVLVIIFIPQKNSPPEALAAGRTYLVDLGPSTYPTGDTGWNNISSPRSTTAAQTLVDTSGAVSTVTLRISNSFYYDSSRTTSFSANVNGTTSSDLYTPSATRDSFFIGSLGCCNDTSAALSVGGLSPAKKYNFRFYASRMAGDSNSRTTVYRIGTRSVQLDATNNINNSVVLDDVTTSTGSLTVNITKAAGAGYGYLGVLEITEVESESSQNQAPVANAGTASTIVLPQSFVSLFGTGTDNDGSISSYSWTKVSGGSATISSPSSAATDITGLEAGTYVFRLTVTDNDGATDADDVLVAVQDLPNQMPSANAGGDKTITLPINSVTLSGSGADNDGSISSYSWTKVSGTGGTISSPSSATTDVSGLTEGSYIFRLTVSDNQGALADDTVSVIVSPNPNSCQAKTIVVLGSSTAEGYGISPISNAWVYRYRTYLDGLNSNNNVINLGVGGYTTYHILPNGSGASGRPSPDTSKNITAALSYGPDAIIVNMPSNDTANGYSVAEQQANFRELADVAANAGVPIWFTTTQPRNLGTTDRNELILMSNWIQSTFGSRSIDFFDPIANADGTIRSVYNMGDGIHVNSSGHLVLHNQTVARNIIDELCDGATPTPPPTNVAPTSNAGSDKTITLPTSSTTLSGSGTDSDGSISSYSWTKVSGGSATISSPSSATTNITGLTQGTYTFRLTVTDNDGATDTDDVTVTVNQAPNQAPTISFGTSSITLSGLGFDSDGTVASYVWTKVSGGSAVIVSPNSQTTNITGLSSGMYIFRLTVTDDDGDTRSADMEITIN